MLSSKCSALQITIYEFYPEANFHDVKVLRYMVISRPYHVHSKYGRPQGVEKYSILDYAYRLFHAIF